MKFSSTLLSGVIVATLSINASAADTPAPAPAAQPADSSLTVGIGVAAGPRYPGSNKTAFGLLPLLDYQDASGFFASTRRGLGWGGESGSLTYSLSLGARGGRDDKDHRIAGIGSGGKELAGMGSIATSATANFGVGVRLGTAELSASLELPVSHRDNGRALHLGASVPLLTTQSDVLSLAGGVHFGDGKYMRTYYGVTALQAQNSGFAAYTPKSGIYRTDLSLAWVHRFDKHWSVTTIGGVERLMSDAAGSPLVRRRTAPEAAVVVGYTY